MYRRSSGSLEASCRGSDPRSVGAGAGPLHGRGTRLPHASPPDLAEMLAVPRAGRPQPNGQFAARLARGRYGSNWRTRRSGTGQQFRKPRHSASHGSGKPNAAYGRASCGRRDRGAQAVDRCRSAVRTALGLRASSQAGTADRIESLVGPESYRQLRAGAYRSTGSTSVRRGGSIHAHPASLA